MAKSLKAKKNSKTSHAASDNKILGLDVKEIGTAIASAVLTELAQVAINKVTQSSKLPNGATVADRTKTSFKDMGNTVKSTLADASPIEIALETLKDVMDRANPMAAETIAETTETVEEVPRAASQFVKETAETTEDRAVDTANLIGNGIAEAIDATKNSTGEAKQAVQTAVGGATQSLKTAFEDATTPDKKQKKKKKKSAKKSGKKNKKK